MLFARNIQRSSLNIVSALIPVVLWLLLLSSCSTLPDYAAPHFERANFKEDANQTTISYRSITITDFQAKEPPERISAHTDTLRAHTAVSIRPSKSTKISISSFYYESSRLFLGKVDNLQFEALMIPEKSWWNPQQTKGKIGYVLQHEQIHFGLMEIAAKRLNKKVREDKVNIVVVDDSLDLVKKRLLEEIDNLIATGRSQILKEHTDFDEDTSGWFDPERQQWWYEKVMKQLE